MEAFGESLMKTMFAIIDTGWLNPVFMFRDPRSGLVAHTSSPEQATKFESKEEAETELTWWLQHNMLPPCVSALRVVEVKVRN
jgi:hypothetical protein